MQLGRTIMVGIISDTHGDLSAAAARALRGVDQIVHAGDLVSMDAFRALGQIAPVTVVRGNMDQYGETRDFSRTAIVRVGGRTIYVIHNIMDLNLDPAAAGFDVVVHGHTHRAEILKQDGVLIINPGSAATKRINKSPSVAILNIGASGMQANIVWLNE